MSPRIYLWKSNRIWISTSSSDQSPISSFQKAHLWLIFFFTFTVYENSSIYSLHLHIYNIHYFSKMSEYTSRSPSLAETYIKETAKYMLAKLHAQYYLDRPQDQQSGRLKRSERRKALSKLFRCLVSQPMKLDITLEYSVNTKKATL